MGGLRAAGLTLIYQGFKMANTDTSLITINGLTPVKLSTSPENINVRCSGVSNCRVYLFTSSAANPPAPPVESAIYLQPLQGSSPLCWDNISFGEPFSVYAFATPIDGTKPFSANVVFNKWDS